MPAFAGMTDLWYESDSSVTTIAGMTEQIKRYTAVAAVAGVK